MSKEDIFKVIIGHVCEVIPKLESHKLEKNDALKDLGANSMDRSEIIMMTLESLALNIPLIEIARAENLGELATILHEKSQ